MHAPIVFDKGRGIGGRLATRRAPDGRQFDHGAQYITATARVSRPC
jgi:renalase